MSAPHSEFCTKAGHIDRPAKPLLPRTIRASVPSEDHNVGSRSSQTTARRPAEACGAETCNPDERAVPPKQKIPVALPKTPRPAQEKHDEEKKKTA